jgi:hypothetical protein
VFRALRAGLRALFHRRTASRELDDELRHYLEQAIQENLAAGMTPEAAERAARLRVGSVEATKEEVRAGAWEAHVDSGLRDLRYGLRSLRRNPGFTLTAVVTLALGIGVTTTMFSVVNAVMLRPLPWPDADRVALIWTHDVRRGLPREGTGHATIADWQASSRVFQDLAFYTTQRVAVVETQPGGERGRTRNGLVSGTVFSLLGVAPALGRVISAADLADRANVAVISHGFWQRRFAAVPDVVGKSFIMEDGGKGGPRVLTVIGVMPPGFYFPDQNTGIWTPATTYWRFDRESGERHRRGSARLRRADPGDEPSAVRGQRRRSGDLCRGGRSARGRSNPCVLPGWPPGGAGGSGDRTPERLAASHPVVPGDRFR